MKCNSSWGFSLISSHRDFGDYDFDFGKLRSSDLILIYFAKTAKILVVQVWLRHHFVCIMYTVLQNT